MHNCLKKTILLTIQYFLSILTLILLYLQGNNIIHILSDKSAFLFFCFMNVLISSVGILFKHKTLQKNIIRLNIAITILFVDFFVFTTTFFISFDYFIALKLIFLIISIKISIFTVDNIIY
jgi:hypothetical protein